MIDAHGTGRRRSGFVAAGLLLLASLLVAAPGRAARAESEGDSEGDGEPPTTTVQEWIDYSKVLQEYAPGAQWSLNGDGCCDQLTMHDGTPLPTKEQLDAFWASRGSRPAPAPPAPAPIPPSLSLDYSKILSRRYPGMQWSLNGDDCCEHLAILDGSPVPTKSELDALWPSVERDLLEEMHRARHRNWPDAPSEPPPAEPVAPSSFVVAANLPRSASLDVGRALVVRDGLVSLSAGWLMPESTTAVLRASNGRTTYVWFLSDRAPTRLGTLRRFAGFRFVLRIDGRVVETIRVSR